MNNKEFFRYVNFPSIPKSLIGKLNRNLSEYSRKAPSKIPDEFLWSDDNNHDLNHWCQQNICTSMYFAFQLIFKDLPLHKDMGSVCKLNYILESGGKNVVNEWYDEDQKTLLQSATIQPMKWHMFKADTYHAVKNIDLGKIRFAITARVFP